MISIRFLPLRIKIHLWGVVVLAFAISYLILLLWPESGPLNP